MDLMHVVDLMYRLSDDWADHGTHACRGPNDTGYLMEVMILKGSAAVYQGDGAIQ